MALEKKTIDYIRKSAKQTFNEAWKYLDKKRLTKEGKIRLLNLVHTSAYLWQQLPEYNATHTSISLWQISRAYAHIGDAANALLFAEQNIRHCKKEKPDGFYTAYAHESMARAYALLNEKEKSIRQLNTALKAIQGTNEKHLDHFFADIEDIRRMNL